MEDYEQLLNEAYKEMKAPESNGQRFEIPKVRGHFEGNKTILTNFFQIASYLRRDPEQFQKFILKELAVSGQKDSDRLVLNRKVPSARINEKIEQYAKEFVICKECGKPDTELVRDPHTRVTFLHCLACGAKHPIR